MRALNHERTQRRRELVRTAPPTGTFNAWLEQTYGLGIEDDAAHTWPALVAAELERQE
jgi:hypothetical protein